MIHYIAERVFLLVPEKSLRFGGGGFSRKIEVGGDWARIRVGMLCSIDSAATIVSQMFMLGMSASTGPSIGSYVPDTTYSPGEFVGGSLAGAVTGQNLTYGGTSYPYLVGAAVPRTVYRAGGAYLYNGSGSTALAFAATAAGYRLRRTPVYVDITRTPGGTGICTVTIYGCNTTTVNFDYRPDHFWQGLDTLSTPVINGQTLTVSATTTAAICGEHSGCLDSFDFWWSCSSRYLDVYAMGATVVLKKPEAYRGERAGGALESFEGVPVGMVTQVGAGTISPVGWVSEGTFVGEPLPNPQTTGYYGTNVGVPFENFESTAVGTIDGTFAGSAATWEGGGTVLGYSTGSYTTGYYGTAAIVPVDTFSSYSLGTVFVDVPALDGGAWWAAPGTVLAT